MVSMINPECLARIASDLTLGCECFAQLSEVLVVESDYLTRTTFTIEGKYYIQKSADWMPDSEYFAKTILVLAMDLDDFALSPAVLLLNLITLHSLPQLR